MILFFFHRFLDLLKKKKLNLNDACYLYVMFRRNSYGLTYIWASASKKFLLKAKEVVGFMVMVVVVIVARNFLVTKMVEGFVRFNV